LIRFYEKTILAADDISEMLSPIKDAKPKSGINKFLSSFPFFSKMFSLSSWNDIIKNCKKEKINVGYINDLLSSYDEENLRFKCTSRKLTPSNNTLKNS